MADHKNGTHVTFHAVCKKPVGTRSLVLFTTITILDNPTIYLFV